MAATIEPSRVSTAGRGNAGSVFRGVLALLALALNLWIISRDSWTDFPGFYAGGVLVGSDQLYKHARYDQKLKNQIPDGLPKLEAVRIPANYLLLKPLVGLGYDRAVWVWKAVLLVSIGVIAWVYPISSRRDWLLTIAAFHPVWAALNIDQDSLLLMALFAMALWLVDRRPWIAGLLLSLVLVKAYVLVLVPIVLAIHRRWRVLAGLAIGAGLLVGVSTLVQGPGWIAEYVQMLATFRDTKPHLMISVRSISEATGGAWTFGVLAAGVLALGLVRSLRLPFHIGMAVALAAGTLAGYHSYIHDSVFTLPVVFYALQSADWARPLALLVLVPLIPVIGAGVPMALLGIALLAAVALRRS